MNNTTLFIFVEGNDDERFFEKIIEPALKEKYANIKIVKYAQKPKKFKFIKNFINSIVQRRDNYIYVSDIDNVLCVTDKKNKIKSVIANIDINNILIVIKEIESWYLAGIDNRLAKTLKIKKIPTSTEKITKEQFNNLIPQNYDRIPFMIKIIENFSVKNAKNKNRSFKYCAQKYNI